MLTVYDDKIFDEELLKKYENCEIQVNRHSSTLVIVCINKLYDILSKFTMILC